MARKKKKLGKRVLPPLRTLPAFALKDAPEDEAAIALHQAQKALIRTAKAMCKAGLNKGTAGNLSQRWVRDGQPGFLITPSGMDYSDLAPADIPWVALAGSGCATPELPAYQGRYAPSSEWRFHHDIYAQRPEAEAVLHAHSPFAVSLACLRLDIPPFHYMIARFGGNTVRCADYATFGTQALSDNALQALKGRSACLLANHGMLVFGSSLKKVLDLGIELESLCEQYWRTCQLAHLAHPALLTMPEMAEVMEKFQTYGKQTSPVQGE